MVTLLNIDMSLSHPGKESHICKVSCWLSTSFPSQLQMESMSIMESEGSLALTGVAQLVGYCPEK